MCVHNDTSGRRHKDWPLRLKWPEERQSFHVELPPRSGCWSQWCGDPHGPLLVLQYRHAANCRSERQITGTLWLTGHTVNYKQPQPFLAGVTVSSLQITGTLWLTGRTVNYKQPQLCFSRSDCFITANHTNIVTNRTHCNLQTASTFFSRSDCFITANHRNFVTNRTHCKLQTASTLF